MSSTVISWDFQPWRLHRLLRKNCQAPHIEETHYPRRLHLVGRTLPARVRCCCLSLRSRRYESVRSHNSDITKYRVESLWGCCQIRTFRSMSRRAGRGCWLVRCAEYWPPNRLRVKQGLLVPNESLWSRFWWVSRIVRTQLRTRFIMSLMCDWAFPSPTRRALWCAGVGRGLTVASQHFMCSWISRWEFRANCSGTSWYYRKKWGL